VTFKVYIPVRYASTRLPGKPLLSLRGKTIMQHVFDNAVASGADEVIIATDDERIAGTAEAFGAIVVRTRAEHLSGTDRIAEAIAVRGEHDDAIIVNVQGDEPQLPASVIRQVAELIARDPSADIASVCEPIVAAASFDDPNIVKVVRGAGDRALYFSRAPIPRAREDTAAALAHCRRHVGIYAYRCAYLRRFVDTAPSALEQIESLEQLRALAHNAKIIVADAVAHCGVGVDTPADYERLTAYV
jgi:3-deoxy-manno-octulosonate cytidylyltransferase (CMP-KDO synthetase)